MNITKDMLIIAARDAQRLRSNVWLVNDKELKIIVDYSPYSGAFLEKHNLDYKDNLIQGFKPDQILKYNTAHYKGGSISIDTFLDIIDKDIRTQSKFVNIK